MSKRVHKATRRNEAGQIPQFVVPIAGYQGDFATKAQQKQFEWGLTRFSANLE